MAESPAIKALEDEIAAIEKAQQPTQDAIQKVKDDAAAEVARLTSELTDGQGVIDRNRAAIALLEGKTPFASSSGKRALRSSNPNAVPADQREEVALKAIRDGGAGGVNGTVVRQALGVSEQTSAKTIRSLLDSGKVKSQGERRSRKLIAA